MAQYIPCTATIPMKESRLTEDLTGFLDQSAPGILAEYSRYIDGDLLGKLITKNYLVRRLGYAPEQIYIPLGRYGDAQVKFAKRGTVQKDLGDGHVETDSARVSFEIKCARINIRNQYLGYKAHDWAFVNLIRSPGGIAKTYDVLIAIGLVTLGLEQEGYWEHLREVCTNLEKAGHPSDINALPHKEAFLSFCSFFVIPRVCVKTNYFRALVDSVDSRWVAPYRAWGYNATRCKEVWTNALVAR